MNRSLSRNIFLLSLLFLLTAFSVFSLPGYKGYVSDYAGVISSEDSKIISAVSETVKKKTGAEIAVLTVNSIAPYGSIEDFSIEVAGDWGIGEREKITAFSLC